VDALAFLAEPNACSVATHMLLGAMRLIDLFCGTGGFARGAERAGYDIPLSVDIDANLTYSHEMNFPNTKLLREDISLLTSSRLLSEVGTGSVDGIIGGPPCQGFSSIGRRDPSDKRRKLLWHFFRLVSEVRPAFFVMENVRGLLEIGARSELDDALTLVRELYDVLPPQILDAADFGAATSRKRIFVVGFCKTGGVNSKDLDMAPFRRSPATIADALQDLTQVDFVGLDEGGFDLWKVRGAPSLYAASLRTEDGAISGHRATVHSAEVAKRFSAVEQGKTDSVGRHPRLAWQSQCPALRAGTGSDKGSYQSVRPIHPSQHRVITVREAARLQGFPDRHRFHPTTWHSFRMIGNSVAPLMAEAILRAVAAAFEQPQAQRQLGLASLSA